MTPDQLSSKINTYLAKLIPAEPRTLYDPVRAALSSGGKRIRPMLTALSAGQAGEAEWLPAAAAVELLHAFTLVHDDIMDNAETRRGRPSLHIAFGMNAAILSGDVIVALATAALARAPNAGEMLAEFSAGFRAVCEGQALDKDFEERDDVSMEEYLTMIELKTARIFELAAALGAMANGGTNLEILRRFAREIGIAFQLQDDLLDLTGGESFGKTIGGDILEGKRTTLFVLAMKSYDKCGDADRTLLDRIRERGATTDDIPLARSLFEKLGVLEETACMAAMHTENAERQLEYLPDLQRDGLLEFSKRLLGRSV
ncbi:MAG TPA: polyprenyl synthetase family protein [Candidatus Kapabacteria bacterium]|nr:polyprenyl synthetase family protein [Candidatus Kapabacteria bacterium]